MDKKILLIGGFGEIVELCEDNKISVIGIVDNHNVDNHYGIPIIGNDDNVEEWCEKFIKYKLVITPDLPSLRKELVLYYKGHGFQFTSLISNFANISKSSLVELGTVIQSGANVSSETYLGKFVKVNTNANIMHNVTVGDFTTIAPNAVVLGHVKIGESCYIGANSTILPHISICDNVIIGAGAVVTKNIETPHTTFVGVPASILEKQSSFMEKISEQYRFKDFTFTNYKKLLLIALKNFCFSFYSENKSYNDKTIILRHDVEFSVPIALEMAKIENELGIQSTYFIQLHGDFYNALESNTFNQLKEIQSLGHEIGLHFDAHFWQITKEEELERFLLVDKDTFAKYFQVEPKAFSFHNNNALTLSCSKDTYAGMINVYADKYKKEIGYCADSTGYWRYEILEDRLKEAKDSILQLLVHDGMWQNEVLPPRRRIFKVIDDHANFMKKSYDDTLIKFGAKNIDWEGDING